MYVCICEHCIVQHESEHTKSMSKHTQHTSSSYIIIYKNIHVLYAHRQTDTHIACAIQYYYQEYIIILYTPDIMHITSALCHKESAHN